MNRLLNIIFIFLLFNSHSGASDKDTYHQLTLEGIEQAYNMQIDEATGTFEQIIKLDPQNPHGYLLQAVNFFYQSEWAVEKGDFEKKFQKYTSKAIKFSKKNLSKKEKRNDALFYLGTSHIYLAAYHAARHNWLRAYWYGKDGINYLKKVVRADPNYYDAYLGLGLYHYYAAVIPKFIKSVTSLLGIEGDRTRGLQELRLAAEKGTYSRAEAHYFLANIFLYIEDDADTALSYSEKLTRRYQQNAGFLTFLAENYQESGRHADAIEQLENALAQEAAQRYEFFQMLIYFGLGKSHFELNNFKKCIPYFEKALTLASKRKKSASWMVGRVNYRLGLSFELEGERQVAVKYYSNVRKSDHKKAHELARKRMKEPLTEIERGLILGKNFAKTKNYDQAIATFETAIANAANNDEKKKIPELRYYAAKTEYDKEDFEEAITALQEVLILNTKDKWIKPWTHFYLGNCYNKTGQPQKALAEYKTAYKFDDNDLRFQIDRRREELQSSFANN